MSEITAILPTSAATTMSQHLSDAFPPDPTPTPPHDPPPPPHPSSDPRLAVVNEDGSHIAQQQQQQRAADDDNANAPKSDLFKLKPLEALQLLSASVEFLVRITGDVPPTPPPKTPTNPQMSNMQVEKENIARSYSEKSLAKMHAKALQEEEEKRKKKEAEEAEEEEKRKKQQQQQQQEEEEKEGQQQRREQITVNRDLGLSPVSISSSANANAIASIDGVRLKHEPNQFQDAISGNFQPPDHYIIWGSDSLPINLQHGAITRKFYSKNEPPISLNQYLLRLHQFCPMSTAVYLATSLYIHRLAVEERTIPVTRRNVHRLVLAGLRVAMKALEDLSYPHSKIAKVGGVSEIELVRLEINFCFLTGFELVVGEEMLRKHWEMLRSGGVQRIVDEMEMPSLKLDKRSRGMFSP